MAKYSEAQKGDWHEYQKLVLSELERHNSLLLQMDNMLEKVNVDISSLKVKSGIWGLAGAAVPIGIFMGLKILNIN